MRICNLVWFPPQERTTHFVQVNDTHSNFTQTLSPVDIGLGCPGNTTTTKLRTDSILGRNVTVRIRCLDALDKPGNLKKEISCVSSFERLYIPIECKDGVRVEVKRKKPLLRSSISCLRCNFQFSDARPRTRSGSASTSGWTFSKTPCIQLTIDFLDLFFLHPA